MNKHKSEVSTLLQNIVTKPVAIIALKFEWQCLKRHTGKAGLWPYGLDAWTLHTWTLDFWTLDDWTLGLWTTGLLDSGQLDAWTLDGWTLGLWTPRHLHSGRLDAWTLDPWSQEILSIFSNICFFLIIKCRILNFFGHSTINVLWFCWTCCESLL